MPFIILNAWVYNKIGPMNDKTNEKKLVEAFRTFFEKSISPYVYSN